MSKLFQLRQWLSMSQASSYLTAAFGEEVTESDIFLLGLENRLTLSVRFPDAVPGRLAAEMSTENAVKSGEACVVISKPERTTTYMLGPTVKYYEGVFDLPMLGGEKFIVENASWGVDREVEYGVLNFDEIFFRTEKGRLIVLLKRNSTETVNAADTKGYSFSRELPVGWQFVIRTAALRGLLDVVAGEQMRASKDARESVERPLHGRERRTLQAIIAALCKDLGYDISKHAKTAKMIQNTADLMGVSIGETTIEGHLKGIPDALAGRLK
jgi:hypothetical protein